MQDLAEVLAIPGVARPEDAFKFLAEAQAAGRLRGVILVLITGDERDIEVSNCGDVRRGEMAMVAGRLLTEASSG